jgi:hypothetical protein
MVTMTAAAGGSAVSQHQLEVFVLALLGGLTAVFLFVMVASVLVILMRGGGRL